MSQPRIMVLGANGQVGWELCRCLAPLGLLMPVSRSGQSGLACDLSDLASVRVLLDTHQPDIIVNAAAYTAVDAAESEVRSARTLNADLPAQLGSWALQHAAKVVHFSTDYVFDGTKASPYTEEDAPHPVSVYGETKSAGDAALLASGAPVWILRVSWVYGTRGKNFLRTMQRLMSERDTLSVVDDQIGAPTWSRHIAAATAALLSQIINRERGGDLADGVFHLSPPDSTSWFGFAQEIQQQLGSECQLIPIPTSQYPTPAIRPLNSRLDTNRILREYGIALPDWRVGVTQALAYVGQH